MKKDLKVFVYSYNRVHVVCDICKKTFLNNFFKKFLSYFVLEKPKLEDMKLAKTIFTSPCLQVYSYKYKEPYYEIFRPISAFCDSVWCGFNNSTLEYQVPSAWLCLPNK